jgi:hypothetical protein
MHVYYVNGARLLSRACLHVLPLYYVNGRPLWHDGIERSRPCAPGCIIMFPGGEPH